MTATAAILLSASERWLGAAAPVGRVSRTMALVAAASLLGHLLVVGTVGVAGRTAVPPPAEIAVEIVQEVPKPAPEPKKPEPAPAKPEPPKPEPTKAEPAKSEPAKAEPEPLKPRPARTRVAKAEPPAPARPTPPPARDAAAEERKLATLQQELESLKAEQAALQAERAAEAATPVALRDTGLGLLPGSFQAVALPNTTDGAGEAASYEALVFSALAKAKGIGRRQGVPGTAGVRFSVDASGRLVAVELIHWSGIPELDSEALAVVRRAVFPPPPQGAQRTFVANVNFEVRAP